MPAPATSSRHLYTGHRRGHIQAAPRLRAHRRRAFVLGPPTDPSFDAIVISFRCVSSGSHMFVFSSHTRPAHRETSTAALTTPALDRRSLRWFGISACTATPEDLPPSLAQHGSCRRSSTSSSSLPFRTHVGARNWLADSRLVLASVAAASSNADIEDLFTGRRLPGALQRDVQHVAKGGITVRAARRASQTPGTRPIAELDVSRCCDPRRRVRAVLRRDSVDW